MTHARLYGIFLRARGNKGAGRFFRQEGSLNKEVRERSFRPSAGMLRLIRDGQEEFHRRASAVVQQFRRKVFVRGVVEISIFAAITAPIAACGATTNRLHVSGPTSINWPNCSSTKSPTGRCDYLRAGLELRWRVSSGTHAQAASRSHRCVALRRFFQNQKGAAESHRAGKSRRLWGEGAGGRTIHKLPKHCGSGSRRGNALSEVIVLSRSVFRGSISRFASRTSAC